MTATALQSLRTTNASQSNATVHSSGLRLVGLQVSDAAYHLAVLLDKPRQALEAGQHLPPPPEAAQQLQHHERTLASLQQRQITIEFVQETLKNFLSQSAAHLTVEAVLKEVANYFNVKIADLKGSSRLASVTRPRQIAMYLSRKLVQMRRYVVQKDFNPTR